MNRKSQIESHMLIYVLVLVIVGTVLIFGYTAITSFLEKGNEAGKVELKSSLENTIKRMTPKFGSVEIGSFSVPTDYSEVCFMGTTNKDELPLAFVQKYPLAADAVMSGNNVFLAGDRPDFFKVEKLRLPNNVMCVPTVDGKMQLRVEGKGNAALVSETKITKIVEIPEGVVAESALISSADYSAVLRIPTGTNVDYPLGSQEHIMLEQVSSPLPMLSLNRVSEVYEFKPDGTVFNRQVPLTLSFDPNKVHNTGDLKIYYFDGADWIALEGNFYVDAQTHTITGYTNHFTQFTVGDLKIKNTKNQSSTLSIFTNSSVGKIEYFQNNSFQNQSYNLTSLHSVLQNITMVFGGLDDAYSPSVITFKGKRTMWIGGWLTSVERGGLDKIYYSEFQNGVWSSPIPSFEKEGYLVNDPSVIQPPSSDGIDRENWLYMYYTALNFPYNDPLAENVVGFASSIDGGKTWTDHGIIINHTNANGCGAWSPSAIVNNNEIWVYYHVNRNEFPLRFGNNGAPYECYQGIYLTKMSLNGWEQIETLLTNNSAEIVNVDVAKNKGKFVMVGNTNYGDKIYRYDSNDGIAWEKQSEPLIDAAGSERLNDGNATITPHLEFIDLNAFNMYFGFGSKDFTSFNSIHVWKYEEVE
jgi:hypothetical protein